ncbi:putative Nitroreductase family [Trypanosoma vivax]|uniref:Nitroreductase domain-containing protein n=1 Tax=Trypanosoma vivax (strain Y486) TaxID=1055687 RepID=G0TYA7_TRYVY|nr:hypothetical protein TRVL_06854 [Trypanosoma vivax]KAH8619585.1 putative Nitroreductase family [Trypanosoma vivax]CCC48952.1 conserved hypothetical protein [Trypanosoma vivax Y486]
MERRSVYNLSNELPLAEDKVVELIKEAVRECPSAFNSQSSRVVILLGQEHKKLWTTIQQKMEVELDAKTYNILKDKVEHGILTAAGSVLFFEDMDTVHSLQQKFPRYTDALPQWSEHASGMAQFAVWTALAQKGIGASLQHFNSFIDEAATAGWNLPSSWRLCAQMPFGKPLTKPGEKTYIPDEDRFIVLK